jgi:pilus assembly protein CpaE
MADEPLTVLIVEDSPETARVLRDIIQGEPDMTVVGLALTGQEGVRRAAELAPDVIIMDIHLPDIDGIEATSLITSQDPNALVIILTSEVRPDYMQRCMLAGARGYLTKPLPANATLTDTIRAVRRRFASRPAEPAEPYLSSTASPAPLRRGKRLAVFSPKGGQGRTTIAVNLAIILRATTDQPVLLIDADLRFGDANVLLDLPSERSIIDLLPHIDHLDSTVLDQVLARHHTGLHLLMPPEHPELAEMITASHIEKLLTFVPRMYDYVIIDCELSYDDKMLAVLDRAESILVVLTPSLGVMRCAKHFLRVAEKLGYPRSKIDFVINRANSNVGLNPADMQRILGPGHYFLMDSHGRLLTVSLNAGQPTVLMSRHSEFTRTMHEIAEHVRGASNGQL